MSKIEVNAIEPQTGTTLTLGASGDTITIPAGATISNSGTAAGFGPTGAVSWDTTAKTTGFTAVSGVGYFCNTTSGAFTVTLPATPSAGAVVGICDYANTFATNNLTVGRNSSKIGGVANNATLSTNGLSVTFVYVDATQGWIVTDSGNRSDLPVPAFIVATGGTVSTCGDYKIHTFTGPGTFTVCSAGNPIGSNSVDYLVVAGGGGGGGDNLGTAGGGGGAGGFRYSNSTFPVSGAPGSPLASATALPVSATSYPITVGAGGGPGPATSPGVNGNNSIFSTITSTAGGGGSTAGGPAGPTNAGNPGGSGGGAQYYNVNANGSGNTPPTSPSQGNPGGVAQSPSSVYGSGGGGGAMAAGQNTSTPGTGGPGGNGGVGAGLPTAFGSNGVPSGGYRYYAGGGGGGIWSNIGPSYPTATVGSGGLGGGGNAGAKNGVDTPSPGNAATANTGGGGGGATGGNPGTSTGGSGGSGIVVIRYKFQ